MCRWKINQCIYKYTLAKYESSRYSLVEIAFVTVTSRLTRHQSHAQRGASNFPRVTFFVTKSALLHHPPCANSRVFIRAVDNPCTHPRFFHSPSLSSRAGIKFYFLRPLTLIKAIYLHKLCASEMKVQRCRTCVMRENMSMKKKEQQQ